MFDFRECGSGPCPYRLPIAVIPFGNAQKGKDKAGQKAGAARHFAVVQHARELADIGGADVGQGGCDAVGIAGGLLQCFGDWCDSVRQVRNIATGIVCKMLEWVLTNSVASGSHLS